MTGTIKISGIDYSVDGFDTDVDRNLMGRLSYDTAQIYIRNDLPIDKKMETLLHEVLHAVYMNAGLQPGDEEEKVVTALSSGLYQFLKDNKDVYRIP
jgi:hypothetical protein